MSMKLQTQEQVRERVSKLQRLFDAPSVLQQLTNALAGHLDVKRFARTALTLCVKNPKLLECSDESLLSGMVQAAELGLELAGPLGHAYLVPRWNGKKKILEATFQVGYRGFIDLAFRSGKIQSFHLRQVRENDNFSISYGTYPGITHLPALKNPGETIGYYAVVFFSITGLDFEFMTTPEVQAHRLRYSPPKDNPDFDTWVSNFDAMALKTVARRLAKRLSLSPELQSAAVTDEYNEAGITPNSLPSTAGDLLTERTRAEEVLEKLGLTEGQAGQEISQADGPAAQQDPEP